ncbi:hypothetical protein JXB28_02410 [Candidatus Woesearchaeota archaeon]|nr:hypothetical protein [Candidatus Woesearchaeota archaeon]
MLKKISLLISISLFILSFVSLGVSYTGNIVYEDAIGALCEDDCPSNLACCPTEEGPGICYEEELCSGVYYFTMQDREMYVGELKRVNSKQHMASSMVIPVVLFLLGMVFIYIYVRLPQQKRKPHKY